MSGSGAPLADALAAIVGSGRVRSRAIDRIAWASDASFYRLVPEADVHARSVEEVRALFALSRARKMPLTFRSAGTSLSGQAITDGLLNPGVVVNRDRRAHLSHLKALPTVEPEVDKCIECGFCEPLCPSRELTLTPRQRIVVRREIRRLEETGGDRSLLALLERDFPYDALETCAANGLCAATCPVRIDTGQLTKRFRAARSPATAVFSFRS